jgi:DNA polymerase-3 subunit delta
VASPTRKASPETAGAPAAYLVRGEDPSLVGQEVQDLLRELIGDLEPSMVVEEHGGAGVDELDVGLVIDALTTPPFLADRRIVVVRDAGRLSPGDSARLVACLQEPAPGVTLLVAAGGGTVPAALVKEIERRGNVVDAAVGRGRARSQWLNERLRNGPVRLDARAAAQLGEHLGGDMSRVRGLLESLAAAYGQGSSIDPERLEPFLGEAGAVAPWELTDAIDEGQTAAAFDALRRLFGAARMHPLAVLALLHRHYQAMLRLEGSGITSADEAAARLGLRSAYPARKALEQAGKLGPVPLGRAVTLLAEADLDIKGLSGLPAETVLEVLVGRLSRLGAGREQSKRRAPARSGSSHRRA